MIHLYCVSPDCVIKFRQEVASGTVVPANKFDINKKYICDCCGKELVSESDSEVSQLLWKLGIEEPKNQSGK